MRSADPDGLDPIVHVLEAIDLGLLQVGAHLEQLVDPVLLVYFPDLRRQRAEKARRFLQSLVPTAES